MPMLLIVATIVLVTVAVRVARRRRRRSIERLLGLTVTSDTRIRSALATASERELRRWWIYSERLVQVHGPRSIRFVLQYLKVRQYILDELVGRGSPTWWAPVQLRRAHAVTQAVTKAP